MSDEAVVPLTIMAISLAIMAAVQIGVIVVAIRVSRKMTLAIEDLRREVRPLAEKVNRLADEATKVTSLAALQLERVDEFMATTVRRVDATLSVVQGLASGPIRQGAAVLTAVKAVMIMVRNWQSRRPGDREHHDEDALFVG